MTIVEGQIEPLKRLKEILSKNGITRFNSVGELNNFIKNYESEKKEIPSQIESAVDVDIQHMQSALFTCQQIYDDLKADVLNGLKLKLQKLEDETKQAKDKSNKNFFNKIFYYAKIKGLSRKRSNLENNLGSILKKKTSIAEAEVIRIKNELEDFLKNKKKIISERCKQSYEELATTKDFVEGLYTLIAGAIGENSVVNSLQQLSDDYYLFNDFSVDFNPPIYNKKENDRIFSIQIDHLLVCQSGIFLLETKNWSEQSIKNLDLRSPVEQIIRTSYALFVLLNSDSKFNDIQLERHHWGGKKIPIRNIIVMTNAKPKEEFKHVKVLSLNELNGYIKYFDQIFSGKEVRNIFEFLGNERNRNL
jgi:hypothetical protein